nr:ATP-dependent DNA helicase PIF1-like [Tanacetum cinerariifolium]
MPAKIKDEDDEPTWIKILERFLITPTNFPIQQIVKETYPNFVETQRDVEYLKERAILTPGNDDANAINAYMFEKLAGESITYNSAYKVYKASTETLSQQDLYPMEFLNSLNFSRMGPHALCLKKELPVMLLRNINPSQGLCNGTQLIITEIGEFIIPAQGHTPRLKVILHKSQELPEYSLSMRYENLSTTPKTKSYEVIMSSAKNLEPILREYEVTSEDKSECEVPVCEDSSTFDVCKDHYEILSDSNNDDISSDDDAFEDIEYVEATPLDSELVSLEEENDKLLSINHLNADIEFLNENPTPDCVIKSSSSFPIFEESNNSLSYSDNSSSKFETFSDHTEETRSGNTTTHANNSLPEYDSFCFEIEPDQGRLTNVVKNDISDNSRNDSLLEEADLFLASDNSILPGIKNFDYVSKGDIHFLEELLVDDSIPLPENESSNFDHPDDQSFPRPPPEPSDV